MTRSYPPATSLERHHMPTGYDISLAKYTNDFAVRIPDRHGPTQSLAGFEPHYSNIIDYIVRITHRIWETDARGIDYIDACYAPYSLVYDDYGLQTGSRKIIDDTRHTKTAYPGIILDAEEIIWAGDDKVGFHTSHLTRITGTNSGSSRYGEPTNKNINIMVIANCVALKNDIFLEHVLYNTSAMLQQTGVDLWDEADRLVSDPPPGWPRTQQVWHDLRRAASPARALSVADPVRGFDPDSFARSIHDNIWNGDMSALDTSYAADLVFEGTTERKFAGRSAYKDYVGTLRAAFPDLNLQVDEVYWMGNDLDGWLVSTRWSADATHLGETGIYRTPSAAQCQIWGITQWRVDNGIVKSERQLFNELDLMMQITAKRRQTDTR